MAETKQKDPSEKLLISKLCDIQSRLNAPKGQYNSFGKYAYRNCEDIVEAVKPLLREAELVLTITDEIVDISNRIYVCATATIHDGAGGNASTGYAREPESKKGMDEMQITGAASSYARKYALCGLFAIDDNKDADSMDNREPAKAKAEAKPAQTSTPENSGSGSNRVPDELYAKHMRRLGDFCDANALNKMEVKRVIETHYHASLPDLSAGELDEMHSLIAEAFGREAVA